MGANRGNLGARHVGAGRRSSISCAICKSGAALKYLVVGGYAVSLHAQSRATKDLDILIKPDERNATTALCREAMSLHMLG
jgi:hypothetical protein